MFRMSSKIYVADLKSSRHPWWKSRGRRRLKLWTPNSQFKPGGSWNCSLSGWLLQYKLLNSFSIKECIHWSQNKDLLLRLHFVLPFCVWYILRMQYVHLLAIYPNIKWHCGVASNVETVIFSEEDMDAICNGQGRAGQWIQKESSNSQ